MARVGDIKIPGFFGGMNQASPREIIRPSESPNMQNFTVKDGVLEKRTGYIDETGSGAAGIISNGIVYAETGNSSSKARNIWAFSDTAVLYKTALAGNWTAVTGGETIISGLDQNWSVTLATDQSDYITYLICVQSHTNSLDASNGSGGRVLYAADPTDLLDTLPGGNGYNADDTEHYCKMVDTFAEHVFIANIYEETSAGVYAQLPFRTRWSNLAEFQTAADWNDVDQSKTAGYHDFMMQLGAIIQTERLRSSLMFYLQRGIVACSHTDSTTFPFRFDTMIPKIGLYSPRLLVSNGDSHFFVGTDRQIYQYFGGRDLRRIGSNIREEFFTDINKGQAVSPYLNRHRSFAFIFDDIQACGFFIPTALPVPDRLYLYFWNDKRWEKHSLDDDVMGAINVDQQTLAGGYDNIPLIGGGAANEIMRWDYAATADVSAAIDSWVQTKEFVVDLKNEYRTVGVWFEASGDGAASSCNVSIINQTTKDPDDSNWTTVTETIGSDWGLHHVDFNVSGYLLKLQFRNNSATQKLRLGSVTFEIEKGARTD